MTARSRGTLEIPRGTLARGAVVVWLAGLLQCELGTACTECRSCRLLAELQHPDVHWYFPLERPRRVAASKLREKLEEARLAELERRRAEPLHRSAEDAPTGIHLGTIENLRARAMSRPAMGPRTVFVIGRAEQMVTTTPAAIIAGDDVDLPEPDLGRKKWWSF